MIKKIIIAWALALVVATGATAATVRPLLLDEIIDSAATAFQGRCIANRTEIDAATNLVVTYTTFEISDVLKGKVATTHVIKQIGGTLPDGMSGMLVHGVPRFVVGEEYVVFLAGVSSLGFSSPIGLGQGNFSVQQSATGKTIATGADFRELTAKMPLAAVANAGKPVRQLGLEAFKEMARSHAKLRE